MSEASDTPALPFACEHIPDFDDPRIPDFANRDHEILRCRYCGVKIRLNRGLRGLNHWDAVYD